MFSDCDSRHESITYTLDPNIETVVVLGNTASIGL